VSGDSKVMVGRFVLGLCGFDLTLLERRGV